MKKSSSPRATIRCRGPARYRWLPFVLVLLTGAGAAQALPGRPFRSQATRFARLCLEYLIDEYDKGSSNSTFLGLENGKIAMHDMRDFERMVDCEHQRPREQWWMELRDIAKLLAKSGPEE